MPGMRPFGDLMNREAALRRILDAVQPVTETERVPLDAAAGRVLAEALPSPADVPAFDRSTMDGYALRAADADSASADDPVTLQVVDEAFAGAPANTEVGPGTCVRIATGAPLPKGADAVQRVEDTAGVDGAVRILAPVRAGQFVQPRGSDLARGQTVLREGATLTPARVGLVASLGHGEVPVRRRPRAVIVPTGDEIRPPGADLKPGEIHDANGYALAAELRRHGADVTRLDPVADELDALLAAVETRAADADLVILIGGASVGERDLAVDVAQKLGNVLVHGVRLKPGKPLLAATLSRGGLLLALPGNPTSALTVARLFAVPALRALSGWPPTEAHVTRTILGEAVRAPAERELILPVRLDEQSHAQPTFKGSGALTSLADSDGWVLVPAGVELEPGSLVEVRAW